MQRIKSTNSMRLYYLRIPGIFLSLILVIILIGCSSPVDVGVNIIIITPTQIVTPSPTKYIPNLETETQSPFSVKVNFEVDNCDNGIATSVNVRLTPEGGLPPYNVRVINSLGEEYPLVINLTSQIIRSRGGDVLEIKVASANDEKWESKLVIPQRCDSQSLPRPTTTSISLRNECNDAIDNDNDGLVDLFDPQCKNKSDNSESQ